MTDAVSLLHACRDNPGDFCAYLVAADFFDDPEEGDEPTWGRALRWMAAHQKWPVRVEVPPPDQPDAPPVEAFAWRSDGLAYPETVAMPDHCLLPWHVAVATFGWSTGRHYYAWTAALCDLAVALVKLDAAPASPALPPTPEMAAALKSLFPRDANP